NNEMTSVGFEEVIYNVSEDEISGDSYVLVSRDRSGKWVAGSSSTGAILPGGDESPCCGAPVEVATVTVTLGGDSVECAKSYRPVSNPFPIEGLELDDLIVTNDDPPSAEWTGSELEIDCPGEEGT